MTLAIEPIGADGSIRMHPIGKASSPVRAQQTGGFDTVESRIELLPELARYLQGLEDYSHVTVVYWMHEQTCPLATTRPQGNPAVPEVGILACR